MQGTRFYQSISVLWNYALLKDNMFVMPHDYLDDLESFFYILCQAMLSRVSAGRSVSEPVTDMLKEWEAARPEHSRSCKTDFVVFAFQNSRLDVGHWGEACRNLLKEFHTFIQGIVRAKDHIRWLDDVDNEDRLALLNDLGRNVENHYQHLDKIFQEALDALAAEEALTGAHLLSSAVGVLPGVSPMPQSPPHGRSLKRNSHELEDTTEIHRPSKRHHRR